MIERIKTVSNPLTIIAIFAGIAEISGTAVLPLLEIENQNIYLWFLMIFPILLITLFFITLNFNYKVLYAPSDFKDENNFLKLFGKPTPGDKIEKVKGEIEEEISNEIKTTNKENNISSSAVDSKYREIIKRNTTATYYLSEELVLNKLSSEFSEINKELVLNAGKSHFMFDGVAKKGENIYAIEVKYMKEEFNRKSIASSLNKINKVYKELPSMFANTFNVLLAVVTDIPSEKHSDILNEINKISEKFSYTVDARIYNLSELEDEFIGS